MFNQLKFAFKGAVETLKMLMAERSLWGYVIFPLILSLLIFWGSYGLSVWVDETIPANGDGFWGWVSDKVNYLIKGSYNVVFNGFFLIIILTPLLAFFSEKVEEVLTGTKFPFDIGQLLKDLIRTIGLVLLNVIIYFFIIRVWNVVSWLFGLNIEWLDETVGIIFSCWFYGLNYADYVLERHRYGIGKTYEWGRKNFWVCFSLGGLYMLMLFVPILGIAISPLFVTAMATVVLRKNELIELHSFKQNPLDEQPRKQLNEKLNQIGN